MHPYMVTKDRANPGMLVTSSCHPNRLGHADPCRAANGASRLLLSKVRSSGLIPTLISECISEVNNSPPIYSVYFTFKTASWFFKMGWYSVSHFNKKSTWICYCRMTRISYARSLWYSHLSLTHSIGFSS